MVDGDAAETRLPLWPDNPIAEDLLGFGDVAAPIVEALKRDRLDPVALGVFGDWGSGKTTALELVRADLAGDETIAVIYWRPMGVRRDRRPSACCGDGRCMGTRTARG
jgi:KAP family P-loop domain